MTNPDDEIRRHPRTIEQDFEGLFRTMRSRRFRNGEDTGGEPANYIYAYPPEQELEVERRIPMLVNRLQSMDPVDSNDSAPGVLVIDLYETVIHIMQSDDILESVIGQEAEMHGGENADNTDGDSDEWPHLQEDDFYQNTPDATLAGFLETTALVADSDQLPSEGEDSGKVTLMTLHTAKGLEYPVVFLTGIGHVYPYIRAHAMLDLIQKIFPASIPVVLFFPGKYEKTATTVSVMRLFNTLAADNYYRAFSLNTMITEGANS